MMLPFASAALFAASAAALVAVVLGLVSGSLTPSIAQTAIGAGFAVAAWTFWSNRRRSRHRSEPLSGWEWASVAFFALFSLRAFLWLVFWDKDEIKVLSPNNLGDLSLHITYIRELASGARFWPENPIYAGAKLTYPLGIDLLHSLLVLAGADLLKSFLWIGLAGCAVTGIALWRWGRAFTLAGFLCNGGLAGFAFFQNWQPADFQSGLAWKSIPLALFVTQRGLLFAVPAGLLLLCSWRSRFYSENAGSGSEDHNASGRLPLWGELLLYGTMPLFHLHTFLFLSFVLLAWFITNPARRAAIARLVAMAFVPATFLVLLVTGNLHGPSVLGWQPGWMQDDADFAAACKGAIGTSMFLVRIPSFWIVNFGLLPVFVGIAVWRAWRDPREVWSRAVLIPAIGVFLLCCFVKFAPWEWDNTKLMLWSYLAVLPVLWERMISRWSFQARALAVFALFWSGFASLWGGMDSQHTGHSIALRSELDGVAQALRRLPVEERFIGKPNYNHPVLLCGRKLVLGYTGHVWSHGYDWQAPLEKVTSVMNGLPGWREQARELGARYLFWGTQEEEEYSDSTQPWRTTAAVAASGPWGTIYDLQTPLAATSPSGAAAASPLPPCCRPAPRIARATQPR